MSHSPKKVYLLHHIRGGRVNIAMLVMLDVVLVLGTPTYPPRNVIVVLMMVLFSYQSSLSLISLQLRRKS